MRGCRGVELDRTVVIVLQGHDLYTSSQLTSAVGVWLMQVTSYVIIKIIDLRQT